MTSTVIGRSLAIVSLLLGASALSACGKSAQDTAKAEICAARTDISNQINTLTGLTLSLTALSQVQTGAEAIASDVTKIKKAEPKLEPQRKEQVTAATETFETQLSSIVSGLASNLSVTDAETHLKAALSKLTTSYRHTLAPISCS